MSEVRFDARVAAMILVASTAVIVIMLELMARALVPCLTYKKCPDAVYSIENIEFNFAVELNSEGYRDAEFSRDADESPTLLIGDSMTFGWGVDEESTFSALLEKKSNTENRFYNLGIEGSGMRSYVRTMLRHVDEAETVVLTYFPGNDIISAEEGHDKKSGRSWRCRLTLCELIGQWLRNVDERGVPNPLARFDLSSFADIDQQYVDWALEWKINPYLLISAAAQPDLNKKYEELVWSFNRQSENKDLLRAFVSAIQGGGKRVIVILLPPSFIVSEFFVEQMGKVGFFSENTDAIVCDTKLHDAIAGFLRGVGAEVIDLQRHFCESPQVDELYFQLDGHLNERGHELLADVLLRRLREPLHSSRNPS